MSKDTIYRQDAMNIADDIRDCISVDGYWAWMERLKALPAAETNIVTVTIDLDEKRLNEIVKEAERRLAAEAEDAEPKKGKWIPVTERLPEEGVMVLVTCYGRDMIIMRDGESLEDAIERVRKEVVNVTVGLVGSDGWYGADYSPMIITPVAWMPLPEPYKED